MTLDEEVLTQTKEIRERLLESERALEHLRADYHHAIRLLHARGGNMREIAEALLLSHQRVHQIVGADAGGPPSPGRHGGPPRGRRHDYRRGPFWRFSPDAREVIVRASAEARELAHGAVEAPHILLALEDSGVDQADLRARVASAYPQGPQQRRGRMRLGHSAKEVIEAADRAAGERHVTASDLAAALAAEGSQARESIDALGVDPRRVREEAGE
ncbi:MAG: hypothetical protein QOH73_2080 [Gaiellaceae bacterium]|nr:hypothetical protein [Gaiellaceae bacterium]